MELLEGLAAVGYYTGLLFLLASAVAFLANRPDRGRRLLAAGLLAIVLGAAGPATVNYILYGEEEPRRVEVQPPPGVYAGCPPSKAVAEFPVEVVVASTGLYNRSYTVEVKVNGRSYGSYTLDSQGVLRIPIRLSEGLHDVTVYVDGRMACSSTVNVTSAGSYIASAFEKAAAAVRNYSTLNPLEAAGRTIVAWLLEAAGQIASMLTSAAASIMGAAGVYPAEALYYLIAMPTMSAPGLEAMWLRVLGYAAGALPAAIAVGLAWRVYWRGEELDLLELGKELLWALTVMLLAPSIYDPLARVYNAIALGIAQLGQANVVYAEALGFIALGSLLSTVAPYMGGLALAATLTLILLVVAGLLKWLLASAVIAVSPLLAVAYLVPPFRRAVDAAATLLAQLWVASLLAAALTGMMSALYTGGGEAFTALAYAIAMPLVYVVAAPLILQLTGMPVTAPLRILAAPFRAAAPAAAATAATVAGPVVPRVQPAAAPTTPTAAPTAPARRVPDIAEILAATRPLRMKYLKVEPVRPAAAPVHPQARPRIEEIQVRHPRAYAIGSRIGDVAARALSGLEQRARLFAAGYLSALERELGIKLPERLKPKPLTPEDIETRRYVVSDVAAKAADLAAEAAKRAAERAKRLGSMVAASVKDVGSMPRLWRRKWS